jgi:RimJ/RimL family protein N-acetyltransferase
VDALTTDRLDLRPFTPADVGPISATYGDPVVMRYVGHGVVATPDGVQRMLNEYIGHQQRRGFSVWAVIERATGDLIGDAGLYTRSDGDVELGYTLRRASWGRGYATEAATAWVQAAFGVLGLEALVAQTDVPNTDSARVLEKAGFTPVGTRMAYGREHRVFALDGARHRRGGTNPA